MAFRVAVIGLGYFSQFHLAAWVKLSDAELAGVADLSAERVSEAVTAYGAKGFADSTEMIAAIQPDILDIVAPPPAHASLIRAALAPGRTIICQKPFCTSLAEAEAIVAEAETAGTTIVIHENFRFQPWYRTIKTFLDDGGMGAVYQCRFALRPGDGRGPDAYLGRQPSFQTMPRFLIHETGVHFIDVFRWLFGDIRALYADTRRLNEAIAGEDAGVMLLEHEGGVRSMLDGNRLSDHIAENYRKTMGEMEIEGEAGSIRLDGMGRLSFRRFGINKIETLPISEPVDESSFGGGCVEALNRHVIDALKGRRELENLAADYLSVIKAADAAYLSARDGRRIELS
jgi:predicted dehydrogenase